MMHKLLATAVVLASAFAAPAQEVTFCAAGDVMMARGVLDRMRRDGISAPFTGITPFVKRHDVAMCNFEGQVSTRGERLEKRGRNYHFRCSPDTAAGVLESGFNVFSLANNHVFDYGQRAFLDTKRFFSKNGATFCGIGENRWEAFKPAIVEKNGLRIAIFSFTIFLPPGSEGRLPRAPQPAVPDSGAIVHLIGNVRPTVDVVVVSYHWGDEYKHLPNSQQQRLGRICVDAGADLVFGHHPHSIQSIELYKEKFIAYSLGNCVFDQKFEMGTEALLLSCTLGKNKVSWVSVMPIVIRDSRPEPARDADFERIQTKLTKYCAGTGVSFYASNGALVLRSPRRSSR